MVPSADVGLDEFKYYASLRSGMPWFKRRIHDLMGNGMMKLCNRHHNNLSTGITMSNLQLLVTEDHLLERILRTVGLPNLRWLRWYKYGHSSLPFWIPMENLRVLHVVGGALKILWLDKEQLRELEIWAPLSKFPKSIRKLKHLEQIRISLPDDNNMRSLPEEICQLSSLKHFELINAWKMKSLPDSIGNLRNLEHLNLSFSCGLERLPNSFENLISLKYLDLRSSYKLIIWIKTYGNIPSLLPSHFSLSRSAEREKWEGRRARDKAETRRRWEVEEATREREWKRQWAGEWAEMRGTELRVYEVFRMAWEREASKVERERREGRWEKVQSLPLQRPRSLQELHIAELPNTIENFCNLEVLKLENSLLKILPPSLSDLRNLKELRLVYCHQLNCLPDSLGLLSELEVKSCNRLVEVRTLPNTLIQLKLISCPSLKKIDGLCGLAKLQILNIRGWEKVEELTGIETLVSLEELRAPDCGKLKRLRGLRQLTKLRLLDVSGCSEIEELEGVEHFAPTIEGRHALHLKIKAEQRSFCNDDSSSSESAGELSLGVQCARVKG